MGNIYFIGFRQVGQEKKYTIVDVFDKNSRKTLQIFTDSAESTLEKLKSFKLFQDITELISFSINYEGKVVLNINLK